MNMIPNHIRKEIHSVFVGANRIRNIMNSQTKEEFEEWARQHNSKPGSVESDFMIQTNSSIIKKFSDSFPPEAIMAYFNDCLQEFNAGRCRLDVLLISGVDRQEILEHMDAHKWALSRPAYDAEWWPEFEEVSITIEPDPSEVPFQGALETFGLIIYGKVTHWGYKSAP